MEINLHNVMSIKTKNSKLKVDSFRGKREVKIKELVIEHETRDTNSNSSIQTTKITLFLDKDFGDSNSLKYSVSKD